MDTQEIKQKIERFENYANGFNHLCGHEILVKNVKVLKHKVIADIILRDCEDGKSERYNKCEYPIVQLMGV